MPIIKQNELFKDNILDRAQFKTELWKTWLIFGPKTKIA